MVRLKSQRAMLIRSALLALCACAWLNVAQAQTDAEAQAGVTGVPPPPVVPSGARAESASVAVSEGISETDNVFLTPGDKQSQTISTTALNVGYQRVGSALTANLAGDFDYLDYLQGAYSPQLLGRFDGLGAISFWGDRLKWVLQDDYGETQLDAFTPTTPTNLEHTNLLLTGPDLTLRPADLTVVRASARYALSTYETSPLNGWRGLEDLTFEQELSGTSSVSLNANFMQLHFDNTDLNPDYDNNRYFAKYSIAGARTQIAIAAGVDQANDGGSWLTTPYGQLDATRQLSPDTSVTLSAGRRLTDAADAFGDLRAGAAGGITIAPVAATMDAYLLNYVSLGWTYQARRSTVALTARWERDTYAIDDAQDVTRGDVELRLGRQLTSVLTANLSATYYRSDYFNQPFVDSEYTGGADVTWQAGRTLAVTVRYAHDFRSTSGGDFGYSANVGSVTLTYQPLVRTPPSPN
jgi:Putative beta-barrel porin 2